MDREDIVAQLTAELQELKIRVAQLEAAAAPSEDREIGSSVPAPVQETVLGFRRGDRVRINNKLRKPATWSDSAEWNQEQAQKATVTHNYKGQVHLITDNGVKTWQATNNLTRIGQK
jgi:hypothetical protein